MNLLEAMDDPELFGPHFAGPSWATWRAFIASVFGLQIDDGALKTFRQCTGRNEPPTGPAREAWIIAGRRAGKSRMLALIAVYLATFRDWSPFLAAGEKGYVVVIASSRDQAKTILDYAKALIAGTPLLAQKVASELSDGLTLVNGVAIEVCTCSHRTIRGRTIIAAILDEVSSWYDDATRSSNSDSEVLAAIRPATATIPGALLVVASSPKARRGILFKAYERYYGQPGAILVWRAPSLTMNPTLAAEVIQQAYDENPNVAASEFGAEFANDSDTLLSVEALDDAISRGIRERAATPGVQYFAFTDPSGGSNDSFTLAIAHETLEGVAVLDAVREREPPFNPDRVVEEYAKLLGTYRVTAVEGDRYGAAWPKERFAAHGIKYETTKLSKAEIYSGFAAAMNAGRVDLLDHPRLRAQLVALERRVERSGREVIDAPWGSRDDLSNAVAGVIAKAGGGAPKSMIDCLGDDTPEERYKWRFYQAFPFLRGVN